MRTDNMLLTIKASDRPGLLHLITGLLNRKLIPIKSLTAAPTDIHDTVLISMEIVVSDKTLQPLLHKLQNIIEVFELEAVKTTNANCLCAAYFKMDKAFLESPQKEVLSKHGAAIVNLYPDGVLVAKHGSNAAISELLHQLDGPYLMGFSQTGLIVDSTLIAHEDIERISRLAA